MNKKSFFLLIASTIFISLLLPGFSAIASIEPQSPLTDPRIQILIDNMSPQEKVGQLFLVTFTGSTVDDSTQIFDLITNYKIGGILFRTENDNFTDLPNTIEDTQKLIRDLQSLDWSNPQISNTEIQAEKTETNNYIPLFIGISQEGDGYPNDEIFSGLTPLPNLMALGATWRPDLSKQVGMVAGKELSNIGFNLFLGPSLDVITSTSISDGPGLGARSFGGDPYWVGEHGMAFISGLHEGSQGRLAVISKHFPGTGSSDRPTLEEVATVRKSLEQLKQIELAPFFDVTKNIPGSINTTDGLLVSHIRYQGFQGNIRATTRPVSFDSQALTQILALTPFSTWRNNGGLIVSDDLGSQAVKRFYDPSDQSFLARIVARDAFLAGNDLLNMGSIVSTDAQDNYTTLIQAMEYFTQKYNEDAAFAQRVDESVKRILSLKYRIFGDFKISNVLTFTDLTEIGQSQSITLEVATNSATLISPDALDLSVLVPSPPGYYDRILFISDIKQHQQCSTCIVENSFNKDSFLNSVFRLYGPQAGGLVNLGFLYAYTLDDLSKILLGGEGNQDLETELSIANWVVISLLDSNSDQSLVENVRRFLFERQEILRNKKVIVFVFGAPNYLDATDISKITAYYGLYSKSQSFIDVAARLLYQELSTFGDLPVSVSGIGYDLFTATSPNPEQVIELFLELPPAQEVTPGITPDATATSVFKVGDTISVKTGLILDNNNRQVPDGTGVRFTLISSVEGNILQVVDTVTTKGIAYTSFGINQPGLVELRATIEPSITSVVMQLDITSEGINVTVVPPTPDNQEITPEIIESPTPTPNPPLPNSNRSLDLGDWFVSVGILTGLSWGINLIGWKILTVRWGIRWGLLSLLTGLVIYITVVAIIPNGFNWYAEINFFSKFSLIMAGAALGWLVGIIWHIFSLKNRNKQTE